jgi:TP901 family phage tail tape measure protein
VASLVSTVGIKFEDFGTPAKLKKTAAAAKQTEKAFNDLAGKAAVGSKSLGLFGNAAAGVGAKATIGAVGVKALGTAVKTALGPIGVALSAMAGLGAAFNELKELDFASAKFRTLGGDSEALNKNLRQLTIELNGAASVGELTGAAYDVASAGFTDAADAALILKAASLGATGGFTDINTSGGAAVKVLNAYGLQAKDAAALMDKFAQTQADGIITIGQYSNNIGKVATTAAGLGIKLEEVNAVLAQSTAAGTNIETAFTGLNSALAKISSGQAGKKLGIELNEATLRTEGLAGALAKLEGFSTGELQEAFGIEAFKGIQVAIQDTEKLNKLIDNQVNSQGRAADAAFTAQDTLAGALTRIGTAFKNLFGEQTELGQALKFNLLGIAAAIETISAVIKLVLAPFRVIFETVKGIGEAIGEALGIKQIKLVKEFSEAWSKSFLDLEKNIQRSMESAKLFGQNLVIALQNAFINFQNWLPDWAKRLFGIDTKKDIPTIEYKVRIIEVDENGNKIDKGDGTGDKKDPAATIKKAKGATDEWKESLLQVKQIMADGLHGAIMGLIDGTKTLRESLAGIAKQIASMFLKKAITTAFGLAEGGYVANGIRPFAAGGYATKPTVGLVGEAGEDEYIIPASKMAQSMQRYSEGARGESVIPGSAYGSSGGAAGTSTTTVNYSGPILNFNSEEFVPKSAVGQIIASATARGAKAGEARTLSSLQNSRSRRSNLGL